MVVFSMLMGGVVTQLWESRNGSGGILGEEEGEISLADYQSPRPKKEGQLLPLTQHQALLLSTGAEPAKIARTPSPVNKTQVSNSPRSTPVPSC